MTIAINGIETFINSRIQMIRYTPENVSCMSALAASAISLMSAVYEDGFEMSHMMSLDRAANLMLYGNNHLSIMMYGARCVA